MSLSSEMPVRIAPSHGVEARASRHRVPVRWPWILVGIAWALILAATAKHATFLVDHQWLIEQSGLPRFLAALIFLACWQVMVVAMMLPSSMPLIYMMSYAARRRAGSYKTLAVFLGGYAAIWTAFAALAFVGDTGLHQLVNASPWLAEHWYLIGTATFALAGAHQFTRLKACCQMACRAPLTIFARNYRGSILAAWRVGLRYGHLCVGTCWAFMLVMFGIGNGSIAWLLALTGIVVVEKTVPGGRAGTPVIGIMLLLFAILWLAQPSWLVQSFVIASVQPDLCSRCSVVG